MSILKLHKWLISNQETLALAESCTGGAIAARITQKPGASLYFLGSFVTYSNEMKEKILGVKKQTLHLNGAVSEEVIREMLQGLFKSTTATYGLAVSGIAGPSGGSLDKPVGTVWYALGKRGEEIEVGVLHLKGSRRQIIQKASQKLLILLWKYICTMP